MFARRPQSSSSTVAAPSSRTASYPSPNRYAPPPKAHPSNCPRTPSLTSSYTSLNSSDLHITPPNSALSPLQAAGMSDRPKSFPLDSPVRDGLIDGSRTLTESSTSSPVRRPIRPLPPLPTPDSQPSARRSRSPVPISYQPRRRSQDGLSRVSYTNPHRPGARRSASSSFLLDGHQSWIVVFCHRPRILASLLQYIDFSDFHALCFTSKAMRAILDERQARDAILSRFIPGYRHSLRAPHDIRVNLNDLEALMLSQAIPLHIYPQLALDIIAGLPHTEASRRLKQFTTVHSQFVLSLHLRAPTLSFLSDLDDPQWRFGATDLATLRELTFPAPLSFPEIHPPTATKENRPPPEGPPRKKLRRISILSFLTLSSSHKHSPAYPRSPPLHHTGGRPHTYPTFAGHVSQDGNATGAVLLRKSTRRFSPPPPEYTPKALKEHRRRSRVPSGLMPNNWRPMNALSELREEDPLLFTPPQPAHLRSSPLPASSASTSLSEASLRRLQSSPVSSNPHDLAMASSRSRAPVCRVFVPCESFSQSILLACEAQLFTAGLWVDLKIGDIVCNLGFVPPDGDTVGRRTSSLVDSSSGPSGPLSSMWWLVFTGQSLVPYRPPFAPALNALNLPSPMYYCHLLPTFTNPRFYLTILPSTAGRRVPELTLVPLISSMRSPATRSGLVRVRTYAWVGRVDGGEILAAWRTRTGAFGRGDADDDANSEFFGDAAGATGMGAGGDGWNVEWVIEAEGTKEGKAGLLQAMDPQVDEAGNVRDTEWEVVRERCSPGRLWMRLLIVPPPMDSVDSLGWYRP